MMMMMMAVVVLEQVRACRYSYASWTSAADAAALRRPPAATPHGRMRTCRIFVIIIRRSCVLNWQRRAPGDAVRRDGGLM